MEYSLIEPDLDCPLQHFSDWYPQRGYHVEKDLCYEKYHMIYIYHKIWTDWLSMMKWQEWNFMNIQISVNILKIGSTVWNGTEKKQQKPNFFLSLLSYLYPGHLGQCLERQSCQLELPGQYTREWRPLPWMWKPGCKTLKVDGQKNQTRSLQTQNQSSSQLSGLLLWMSYAPCLFQLVHRDLAKLPLE